MQLQIAFDRMPLDRALDIVREVRDAADWIEIGTSMVKHGGVAAIARFVEAAGSTPVLADLKTADDAAFEFGMIFDAGARAGTVLALAADASIDTAVSVAGARGGEALIDLMLTPADRAAALADRLPEHAVLLEHVGKDSGSIEGDPLAAAGPWVRSRRVAVAGGLTTEAVGRLRQYGDGIRVIVGSAITGAHDPVAAAAGFRAAADGAARARGAVQSDGAARTDRAVRTDGAARTDGVAPADAVAQPDDRQEQQR